MTVPVQTPINRHTANGVTTVFTYTFKVLTSGDLEVSLDGAVQTTGFTVSGIGANSGSVTFTTAPASGVVVVLRRVMAYQRTTDYQDQGAMPASTVDDDHDATVMMVQQVDAALGSALKYPILEGLDGTLPDAADRANKYFAFGVSGEPVVVSGTTSDLVASAFMETLLDDADAAAARTTLNVPSRTGSNASGTWGISISGNADTATKLQTARTIGGVSFDGSANINLPGVNSAGNQNTTGNAATATQLSTASGSAPSYAARAWVRFDGTGTPAIAASGNVSSITDYGTGDFGINFTTAMQDANYCLVASAGLASSTAPRMVSHDGPQTVSQARLAVRNADNAAQDADRVNVAIFR